MSWPRKHERKVRCVGFDRKYLPAIQNAIDNQLVNWTNTSFFMSECVAKFEWAECEWEVLEQWECIVRILLLSGTVNEEALTFAALKGKIETS